MDDDESLTPDEILPLPVADVPARKSEAPTYHSTGAAVVGAATTADLSFPPEGQDALHYAGTEPLSRDGYTFAPDSLTYVPSDVAARLAGHDHLRIVQETAQSWPNFVAMRQRLAANKPG